MIWCFASISFLLSIGGESVMSFVDEPSGAWKQVEVPAVPAAADPTGWDEPLSAAAYQGLLAFNQGHYFEQHEYLETAWRAETRPIRAFYQGILQVGLAFLQIQQNNWNGAIKMFHRGLPRLYSFPAVCQGVRLDRLRATATAIQQEIAELGPKRLVEFDQRRFPQIEFVEKVA
jgi:predicted metal-dependent hydrolase